MTKNTKAIGKAKTPISRKNNLKAEVKKSSAVIMPRIAANHNETLLVK